MKLLTTGLFSNVITNPALLFGLFFLPSVYANCDFPEDSAEIISGSVYIERNNNDRRDRIEAGIAGVSVSNGCEVVPTHSGGNYRISIHETQILFISKPAEFDIPVDENNIPQFYYRQK